MRSRSAADDSRVKIGGLGESSVVARRSRLKLCENGPFFGAFQYALRVVPLVLPARRRCLVLSGLGVWFGLRALTACGDANADPIVLTLPSYDAGLGGTGPGNPESDLCAPCASRADCDSDESCVELSRGGERFCSRSCSDIDDLCPSGYSCSDVYNVPSLECVPDTGTCQNLVF